MDYREFDKNRAVFPPEEVLPYRGQYIAWSPDGTRIIASEKDGIKLDETVRTLGYDPSQVVYSSVPDEERLFIEPMIPPPRTTRGTAILDLSQFSKNQLAFPPEKLLQYRGKDIAWSPDGSRVIASEDDLLRLVATVKALGYDPSEVLFSSVPDGDSFIA